MASATKKSVPVPKPPYEVTLVLDQDEAEFLTAVLANVGGDPVTSPRKHQESISGALHKAGVPTLSRITGLISTEAPRGSIYFRNYEA